MVTLALWRSVDRLDRANNDGLALPLVPLMPLRRSPSKSARRAGRPSPPCWTGRGWSCADDIPANVGRSPVERTELRYRTNVCLLGAWRQIAHRHVVNHALAQRRDRLGHRWTPVNWTARTRNPDIQDASPRRALPCRKGGNSKRQVVRRIGNGSVEPYSPLLVIAESPSLVAEGRPRRSTIRRRRRGCSRH
jgi:hypothetical protein